MLIQTNLDAAIFDRFDNYHKKKLIPSKFSSKDMLS